MKRRSHLSGAARVMASVAALGLGLSLNVGMTAGCGRGEVPAGTHKDAASKAGKDAHADGDDHADKKAGDKKAGGEKPGGVKAGGEHAEAEGGHHDEESGAVELSEKAMKRAGIEIADVRAVDASSVLLAPANLEPNADKLARVGPRVSGRIARVAVSLGATVKAGQALATIRSPEAAEAAAVLDSAKAAEKLAQASLARERDLFERKISARREVLEAEAAAASARATVQAAEARLAEMGFARGAGSAGVGGSTGGTGGPGGTGGTENTGSARGSESAASAGSTASSGAGAGAGNRIAIVDPVVTVTSPIAGTVIERTAAADAPVQPDSVLFTIADLRSLWLTVKVPELNAPRIRRGQRVEIDVRALPDTPIAGTIDYVAPILDVATRTVDVRLSVPNPQGALRPGMSATAKFELAASGGSRPSASFARILVPRAAVQELNQASVVFVATAEERRFEPKPVTLGASYGPDVEILSGLTPGDRIVIRGAFTLKAQAVRGGAAHDH